ncbi:hypothetical protein HRG_009282 [Hirsutella rhossiliensis]|uniref:Uncharacterized protein n=1 Tax=Hirsutella rhossiliensis TaxID=111463 RepID=A0A9P8MQM3_9HYPO|nr:uncharacterized protein HRG_09282 [Hirsutella rhossiliensis]KAH0959500.1 hypothetical protein HRG_09282 [Hirsutella rhossiliensis]
MAQRVEYRPRGTSCPAADITKLQYRMVEQGYAGKFPLQPEGLPANIGSDGATVCVVFFVPTKQGNALVGHVDNACVVRASSGEKYNALVRDAKQRISGFLGGDTVDPTSTWYVTDNDDKHFGKAVREAIIEATGVSTATMESKKRNGFMVPVEGGIPKKAVWADGNGVKDHDPVPVTCATKWTNEMAV